jgi:hypothetical protein
MRAVGAGGLLHNQPTRAYGSRVDLPGYLFFRVLIDAHVNPHDNL